MVCGPPSVHYYYIVIYLVYLKKKKLNVSFVSFSGINQRSLSHVTARRDWCGRRFSSTFTAGHLWTIHGPQLNEYTFRKITKTNPILRLPYRYRAEVIIILWNTALFSVSRRTIPNHERKHKSASVLVVFGSARHSHLYGSVADATSEEFLRSQETCVKVNWWTDLCDDICWEMVLDGKE